MSHHHAPVPMDDLIHVWNWMRSRGFDVPKLDALVDEWRLSPPSARHPDKFVGTWHVPLDRHAHGVQDNVTTSSDVDH